MIPFFSTDFPMTNGCTRPGRCSGRSGPWRRDGNSWRSFPGKLVVSWDFHGIFMGFKHWNGFLWGCTPMVYECLWRNKNPSRNGWKWMITRGTPRNPPCIEWPMENRGFMGLHGDFLGKNLGFTMIYPRGIPGNVVYKWLIFHIELWMFTLGP